VAKKVNIRWVAHSDLSAAHAACVVARGIPCADQKTEQLLVGPVTEINNRLLSASIDVGAFWQRYMAEILNDIEISRACTISLLSSGCSELQVEQTSKAVSNRLSDARLAFLRRFPKLGEQLELRARPLRDRWDTFGPGLLTEVERQIWENSPPDDWWASRTSALMIQPVRGGDGGFDAEGGKFWIEAMLTDVDQAVPEVLRVAWLITRMAIETHTRDRSADQPLAKPWSLVSVPLVLTAAANLELINPDRLPIKRALELWQSADVNVAEILEDWWRQLTLTSAPLPVALKELDQTLAADRISHDVSGNAAGSLE
jgi:hypothetical protein